MEQHKLLIDIVEGYKDKTIQYQLSNGVVLKPVTYGLDKNIITICLKAYKTE